MSDTTYRGRYTDPAREQHIVIKIDAGGELIWQRGYVGVWETSYSRLGPAILETRDGSFLLASQHTMGSGFSDALLVKLGPTGDLEWSTVYDAMDWTLSSASSLSTVREGGFIMAGQYSDDMWVLRFDDHGDLMWQRSYSQDGRYNNSASSIMQTSDGGFIVAGMTQERDTAVPEGDIWVLKLDPEGLVSRDCPSEFGEADEVRAEEASLTMVETSMTVRTSELAITVPELVIVHHEATVVTQCER